MSATRPLELVFLTNFSDACFRVTPAVAQLVDDFDVRLTLLHLFDPARTRRETAEIKLRSFFPEADRFSACRRVILEGDLDDGIEWLKNDRAVDLLVAPSSDPLGLPHLARSRRARVLDRCGATIWTIGRDVAPEKLRRRPREIACWLDFDTNDMSHVDLAWEYALRLEGRLHLLHVSPDIDEGSLFAPSTPLGAGDVIEALRSRLAGGVPKAEVHVSFGGRRAVVQLLRRWEADLLFVGRNQAIVSGWLGVRMNPVIGAAPCPVICVGDRPPRGRLRARRIEDQAIIVPRVPARMSAT